MSRAPLDSLEPNVVDAVRTGKYRSLFHPESAYLNYFSKALTARC
jgi:hypothetical protein